ncbi:hypothetical protein GCM10007989_25870 [Devosia pacifica]|uniref:Uncharacterized protein n=1 Tax=Devosia pacifica TaxID=1335967 RepID=A0A918SAG3_9HYPH|nr:hypothetical protein GCM10007989_25870 [Devosia pacifica]
MNHGPAGVQRAISHLFTPFDFRESEESLSPEKNLSTIKTLLTTSNVEDPRKDVVGVAAECSGVTQSV